MRRVGGVFGAGQLMLDRTDPINKGLVCYCPTTEGVGGLAVDIAEGHPVTLSSGATWRPTQRGNSPFFSDNSGRMLLPSSIYSDVTTEASLVLWVRKGPSPATLAYAPGNFKSNGDGDCYYPFLDGLFYFDWLRNIRIDGASAVTDTTLLHMLAVTTKPGSGGYIAYQNTDVWLTSTGDASILAPTTQIQLGGRNDDLQRFSGWMGNVRFYKRALRIDEVRRLWREPFAGTVAALSPTFSAASVAAFQAAWARNANAVFTRGRAA